MRLSGLGLTASPTESCTVSIVIVLSILLILSRCLGIEWLPCARTSVKKCGVEFFVAQEGIVDGNRLKNNEDCQDPDRSIDCYGLSLDGILHNQTHRVQVLEEVSHGEKDVDQEAAVVERHSGAVENRYKYKRHEGPLRNGEDEGERKHEVNEGNQLQALFLHHAGCCRLELRLKASASH